MLKLAAGSALLVTATQCLALSLGATQGNVIIGRPLDILVQTSIDSADTVESLCLSAEVSYGEARLPASAVTAAIQKLGAEGSGLFRVRASIPVNEPLVTLVLKAGCHQSYRRSYSLLADLDAMPTAPSREVAVSRPVREGALALPPVDKAARAKSDAAASPKPVPSPKPVARRAESATSTGGMGGALVPETPIRLTAPVARPQGVLRVMSKIKPVSVPAAAKPMAQGALQEAAPKVVEPSGPRLKLDPIEVAPDTKGQSPVATPYAKPETAVPAPAGTQTDMGAQAPAQASPPASVQGDGTNLNKELQALRQEQERLRLSMETVNAQLLQARQDRFSNPLVYGLAGLSAVLLGGLWYLRRRQSTGTAGAEGAAQPRPWWAASRLAEPGEVLHAEAVSTAHGWQSAPEPVPSRAEPVVTTSPLAVEAVPSMLPEPGLAALEVAEAGESVFLEVPITPIDIDALLDLWQQLDFLVSIGQDFDAEQTLEAFVLANPRCCEAPYLRWLKLAGERGDQVALARARSIYERHFHRMAPDLVQLGQGLGLLDETTFMARLSAVWPLAESRQSIEAALLSQPADPRCGLNGRNIQAFEDLVLLHGLLDALAALSDEVQVSPVEVPSDMAPLVDEPLAAEPAPAAVLVATNDQVSDWLTVGELPKAEEAHALVVEPKVSQLGDEIREALDGPLHARPARSDLPPLDFDFDEFTKPDKA